MKFWRVSWSWNWEACEALVIADTPEEAQQLVRARGEDVEVEEVHPKPGMVLCTAPVWLREELEGNNPFFTQKAVK